MMSAPDQGPNSASNVGQSSVFDAQDVLTRLGRLETQTSQSKRARDDSAPDKVPGKKARQEDGWDHLWEFQAAVLKDFRPLEGTDIGEAHHQLYQHFSKGIPGEFIRYKNMPSAYKVEWRCFREVLSVGVPQAGNLKDTGECRYCSRYGVVCVQTKWGNGVFRLRTRQA